MPSIEGSFGVAYGKGPHGWDSEEVAACKLAAGVLNALESYFWVSVTCLFCPQKADSSSNIETHSWCRIGIWSLSRRGGRVRSGHILGLSKSGRLQGIRSGGQGPERPCRWNRKQLCRHFKALSDASRFTSDGTGCQRRRRSEEHYVVHFR